MESILAVLLWVSIVWIVYVYLGYPAILSLLARLRRPSDTEPSTDLPFVSVLTAAFNEAAGIEECVRNKLALDYPHEKLEVIVVSDESEDGTDEIVERLGREFPGRVQLARQVPRQGKTAGLNLIVPRARGEVLVFSDANSIYEPQALRHIVARFDDPSVGYVTGKMVYTDPDGSVTGDGCTAYMRYENQLRHWESAVGSVVGVDGGIDAIRTELYRPMRADQLPDFVLPLSVVEQGRRVVYEPQAVLREPALSSGSREYRMRVRVSLRALWALHDMRKLFSPLHYGLFSWQLASHKLFRYLVFIPQAAALLTNAALLSAGPFYQSLMGLQLIFYLMAGAGHWAERESKSLPLVSFPYYLTLLNVACAHATWRYLRGQKQVLWQPRTG